MKVRMKENEHGLPEEVDGQQEYFCTPEVEGAEEHFIPLKC